MLKSPEEVPDDDVVPAAVPELEVVVCGDAELYPGPYPLLPLTPEPQELL